MAKLTKREAQLHREACALVGGFRALTEDEKDFVLTHWQESSTAVNSLEGAFFTPLDLARDLAVELIGTRLTRIIDLGAGIGHLGLACQRLLGHRWRDEQRCELVCVERNPDYVRVGRKILPEARWICADILDLPAMQLGLFDCAIGNPPFGAISRSGNAPGYQGRRFEYHTIAVAAALANHGVFLVPQESAPFSYSGRQRVTHDADEEYERFHRATGIELESNCGLDTSVYDDQWHGVSPRTEIVLCDFTKRTDTEPPEPAPGTSDQRALSMP